MIQLTRELLIEACCNIDLSTFVQRIYDFSPQWSEVIESSPKAWQSTTLHIGTTISELADLRRLLHSHRFCTRIEIHSTSLSRSCIRELSTLSYINSLTWRHAELNLDQWNELCSVCNKFELKHLDLTRSNINDSTLSQLIGGHHGQKLNSLGLEHCLGLSTKCWDILVHQFTHLSALDMSHNPHLWSLDAKRSFIQMHDSSLVTLDASFCDLNDAQVRACFGQDCFENLLYLNLCGNTSLTPQSLNDIHHNCTQIIGLDLLECKRMTVMGQLDLIGLFAHLKQLSFTAAQSDPNDLTILSSAESIQTGFKSLLKSCKNLTQLRIDNLQIPLMHLELASNLERLSLSDCPVLNEDMMDAIAKIPKLKSIVLDGCIGLQSHVFSRLAKCRALIDISVRDCHLLDDVALELVITSDSTRRWKRLNLQHCCALTDHFIDVLTKQNEVPCSLELLNLLHLDRLTGKSLLSIVTKCRSLVSLSTSIVSMTQKDLCNAFEKSYLMPRLQKCCLQDDEGLSNDHFTSITKRFDLYQAKLDPIAWLALHHGHHLRQLHVERYKYFRAETVIDQLTKFYHVTDAKFSHPNSNHCQWNRAQVSSQADSSESSHLLSLFAKQCVANLDRRRP